MTFEGSGSIELFYFNILNIKVLIFDFPKANKQGFTLCITVFMLNWHRNFHQN